MHITTVHGTRPSTQCLCALNTRFSTAAGKTLNLVAWKCHRTPKRRTWNTNMNENKMGPFQQVILWNRVFIMRHVNGSETVDCRLLLSQESYHGENALYSSIKKNSCFHYVWNIMCSTHLCIMRHTYHIMFDITSLMKIYSTYISLQ